MKRLYVNILAFTALLCSCSPAEGLLPQEPQAEQPVALELSMSTAELTKALVKDTKLPDGSSVGITIKDDYGVYTGELFTNVKYTANQESGNQVWSSESPILLSSEMGTLFAFYPFSEAFDQISSIPLRATSVTQVDCMYGVPVTVNKDKRNATIVMKHALAAVKISYVRGTYTGAGKVTKVSFGGDCIGTAAYLDATDGSIFNITGKGGTVAPAMTAKTLTFSIQESEIIVIPSGATTGKVVITIDGTDYTLEFGDIILRQGEITQFHLTVNSGELSLSDITVSEWTYGETQNTAIKVSDKVTLTGDLEDIAVYNSVSDGVVTITAVPKTPARCKEVEPVTLTGTATLTQSSDIETGIRTITLSDIKSAVTVNFTGTYTYDLVAKWEVTAGTATQMLYRYFYDSDIAKITRMREGDTDIQPTLTKTFSTAGVYTYKYSFTDHVIPYDLFDNCPALIDVKVSNEVTEIKGYAFSKTSITHFELPETVQIFGSGVLYDCTKLKSVDIPDSLTEIYDSMFRGCESLQTIRIPDGVTRFGDFAFDGCSSLASIIIPAGVTYIGNYCFSDCSNLRHIVSFPLITPSLGGNYRYNFLGVAPYGVLAVPVEAKTNSNYSYWVASNLNLGAYGWTLVYMD
ncbi:MAG: leucine-rich repeat protein [Bacteroidales bacterium]|nr:leucine-rich repeat protein [Bacteroidales bacterium]